MHASQSVSQSLHATPNQVDQAWLTGEGANTVLRWVLLPFLLPCASCLPLYRPGMAGHVQVAWVALPGRGLLLSWRHWREMTNGLGSLMDLTGGFRARQALGARKPPSHVTCETAAAVGHRGFFQLMLANLSWSFKVPRPSFALSGSAVGPTKVALMAAPQQRPLPHAHPTP